MCGSLLKNAVSSIRDYLKILLCTLETVTARLP